MAFIPGGYLNVEVFVKAIALFLAESGDRFYPLWGLDKGDRFVLWGTGRSLL
ncbi:MAG: hypothetical protein KAF91_00475 [Nostoc sp. TH1S01]|nr:hypothetical protein [Nostoc sp. TH1S01]